MKFIFLSVFLLLGTVYGSDKIRLEDVNVLTLYKGKMTNGRRASPIPQLECIGGSARCGAATPDVVQCYNRGSDGYDIQWECKADLDNDYRFGRVEVQCEGYDYPDDEYILKRSCGLKFEFELTEAGRERILSRSWGFSSFVGLILIICIIYFCCLALGDSTSCCHYDRYYYHYHPPRFSWFGGSGYLTGGGYSNSSVRSSGSRMTSGFGGTSRR